jgi:hypothetical protein
VGVAFFTDRLRPSSTSACGFDGTYTFDFDDTRALTFHDGARDSPGESSPDGHMRQGWLLEASGAPHPHRHDHLNAAVSNPDLCSRRACQSKLACGYVGRARSLDEQWDLGTCSPTLWL